MPGKNAIQTHVRMAFFYGHKEKTMKILMVDNYDSFTFNLVQLLRVLGAQVIVYRNDAISLSAIFNLDPAAVVISPGPKGPA
ncbi:MAG: glutamine amidotransferase-related protein, partial [Desulfovermiculus sp.]